MSVLSVYEKMQKEGKLSKPIHLQQPTPDNPDGRAFGGSDDGDYNAEIKSIVNEKVVNNTNFQPDLNELNKLKKRVKFLEDSLKIIMEQHMELMRK